VRITGIICGHWKNDVWCTIFGIIVVSSKVWYGEVKAKGEWKQQAFLIFYESYV